MVQCLLCVSVATCNTFAEDISLWVVCCGLSTFPGLAPTSQTKFKLEQADPDGLKMCIGGYGAVFCSARRHAFLCNKKTCLLSQVLSILHAYLRGRPFKIAFGILLCL